MTAPSQIAVRDNDGRNPCIPPHVLAEVVKRAAQRAAQSGRHARELQKGLCGAAAAYGSAKLADLKISPGEPAAPAA